ncbi:hypothetical protein RFUL19S_04239 [Rhizobacter fulvus]
MPKKPSRLSKLWSALNSHFVLWFLSAVLLSGLSFSYAKWSAEAEAIRKEKALIIRLDQEIVHRMSYGTSVAVQIQSFRKMQADDEKRVHLKNGRVILGRVFGLPDAGYVLYPEFKERTLESLMRELATYLPERESSCIVWAAHDVWEMGLRFQGIDKLDTVANNLQSNLENVASIRWGVLALWGIPGQGKDVQPKRTDCGPTNAAPNAK